MSRSIPSRPSAPPAAPASAPPARQQPSRDAPADTTSQKSQSPPTPPPPPSHISSRADSAQAFGNVRAARWQSAPFLQQSSKNHHPAKSPHRPRPAHTPSILDRHGSCLILQ